MVVIVVEVVASLGLAVSTKGLLEERRCGQRIHGIAKEKRIENHHQVVDAEGHLDDHK